jgi:L-galactose dehydrogenase/L-glyceraldehyde 3-phosphate reductase
MEYRTLGKTGLRVSALGFGCGNVGGLMVRGGPAERERAVARALELGINYFDTAPSYGDGLSERHLGQALRALKAEAYVGTKFRLDPGDAGDIRRAIARSLEASLGRLGLERVDLLQLHNPVGVERHGGSVDAKRLLAEIVPALEALRAQGKMRFYGITGLGETGALHRAMDAGTLDTVQVCYNLLNPSAGVELPPGFPGHDFGRLLDRAARQRLGVIAIRVLAAGALSGVTARHPIAAPAVAPIASGPDYAADVRRAQLLGALAREGDAGSLVEAALRFTLSHQAVSTVLVGYSSLEQLEYAAGAISRGPLSTAALGRLAELWRGLAAGAL